MLSSGFMVGTTVSKNRLNAVCSDKKTKFYNALETPSSGFVASEIHASVLRNTHEAEFMRTALVSVVAVRRMICIVHRKSMFLRDRTAKKISLGASAISSGGVRTPDRLKDFKIARIQKKSLNILNALVNFPNKDQSILAWT